MELRRAIELFLGEYKASTRKAYGHALLTMQDHIGPARELSGIKPELMVEYFQWVKTRDFAPATVQKHIKAIKTFFNWCVKLELIPRSPAFIIKGKKLPRAVDRAKAMTDAELNALLEAVRYKPRDFALILFLADTGCRRGGAVGLRLQDVNWEKLVAVVTEKGEQSRNVAFSEQCARALVKWLSYRSKNHRVTGETLTNGEQHIYLFSRDGKLMQAENVSLIIRRACKAAGIRILSSHSLRHRKGHQLADARVAPSIAATALGHSDPVITLNYYYPHDWESAERALRELFTDPNGEPQTDPKVLRFGTP